MLHSYVELSKRGLLYKLRFSPIQRKQENVLANIEEARITGADATSVQVQRGRNRRKNNGKQLKAYSAVEYADRTRVKLPKKMFSY